MALTEEQEIAQRQADRDALAARNAETIAQQTAITTAQINANAVENNKSRRMEIVRIAQGMLATASQSKPVGERDVSAADIKAYAEVLQGFVDAEA